MLQSRCGFLIGAGAALAFPGEVVMLNADVALLASLTHRECELVLEAIAAYPALSLVTSIETLNEAGM